MFPDPTMPNMPDIQQDLTPQHYIFPWDGPDIPNSSRRTWRSSCTAPEPCTLGVVSWPRSRSQQSDAEAFDKFLISLSLGRDRLCEGMAGVGAPLAETPAGRAIARPAVLFDMPATAVALLFHARGRGCRVLRHELPHAMTPQNST